MILCGRAQLPSARLVAATVGRTTDMRRLCLLITVLTAATRVPAFPETPVARADEQAFVPGDAVRTTVSVLERESLTRKRLDAEMSAKWLEAFLDRLDPKRMYFLQADASEFRRSGSRLGDLARAGDFGFARQVRQQYTKRVAEAVSYASQCLSLHHDYSLDEHYPMRFAGYAADAAELHERWRLRIKFELLIETAHGVPAKDAEAQLGGRYARIARQAHEMTDERLCGAFLDSLAACYGPHCTYYYPALEASFRTGPYRTYSLGLSLRETLGEHIITSVHPSLLHKGEADKLIGWQLLAIRRIDGGTYDLVEIDPLDLRNLINLFGPFGPLEDDTEIILELMNPVTFARQTITWPRFLTH